MKWKNLAPKSPRSSSGSRFFSPLLFLTIALAPSTPDHSLLTLSPVLPRWEGVSGYFVPSPNLAKTLKVKMTETDRCFKILMFKPQELPPHAQQFKAEDSASPQRSLTARAWSRSCPLRGGRGEDEILGCPLGGEERAASRLGVAAVRRRFATTVSRRSRRQGRPLRGPSDKHAHAHMLATPQDSRPSSPQPPSNSRPAGSRLQRKGPKPRGPPGVGGCAPTHPLQPFSAPRTAAGLPPSAPAAQLSPGEVPPLAPPSASGKLRLHSRARGSRAKLRPRRKAGTAPSFPLAPAWVRPKTRRGFATDQK